MSESLEFRRLVPELHLVVRHLFQLLAQDPTAAQFHPHPFSDSEADRISHYVGRDLYFAAVRGDTPLAYGMLRGWDEGFEVPSLGIAVVARARGSKLGRAFMHFLHSAARANGAKSVRLKVYPANLPALHLYRSLGYAFSSEENGQTVGNLEL